MKRAILLFVVASVFSVLGVSVISAQDTGAEEEELTIENAPEWTVDTAQHAGEAFFGSVTLEAVQFDEEGDLPTYEFTGTAEGVEGFEIDVYPDGTLSEVEETIADADVPAEVTTVLTTYFAGFEAAEYERSTRPGKSGLYEVWYEFAGTLDGADLDIEINEDGSMIVVELPSEPAA